MLRLLTAFYSAPWAVDVSTMRLMCQVVDRWALGIGLESDAIHAAVHGAPAVSAQRRATAARVGGGAIGVVPVYGVLVHRAFSVERTSQPLTSTERLAALVRSYAADPAIDSIVLDVDSPGGSVFGVQELANAVDEVRGDKPIVAVANGMAASGAYWVASQADELIVTPSGMVGGIGVIMPHADMSGAYAKAGVRKTFITAGKYKAEGNDTAPLDQAARDHMQALVDAYGADFTRAVARGRGLSVEIVRGPTFGQGRMRLAGDAVGMGMADSIATLEQTIARLARSGGVLAPLPKGATIGFNGRRGMTGARAARVIALLEK